MRVGQGRRVPVAAGVFRVRANEGLATLARRTEVFEFNDDGAGAAERSDPAYSAVASTVCWATGC